VTVAYGHYRYLVDWNNDGDFGEGGEDISAYVIKSNWKRGRGSVSPLTGRSQSGSATLTIDNATGYFSKKNAASPYYGKMKLGRKVRIEMKIGSGGWITMFTGELDTVSPVGAAQRSDNQVTLTAKGIITRLGDRAYVTVEMQVDIATGAAVALVFDAIGFTAYSVDTGQTTMSRWWTNGKVAALEAIRQIEETELGFFLEGRDGSGIFQDRSYRFTGDRLVSQACYTNMVDGAPAGSLRFETIEPIDRRQDIYNIVEVDVRVFNKTEDEVLWTLVNINDDTNPGGAPILIAAGDTFKVRAKFPNPTTQNGWIAVDEWGIVDLQANSAGDGSGDDLTELLIPADPVKYSNAMDLEFHNTNAVPCYITVCVAHGVAVVEGDPIPITKQDDDSIADIGEKTFTFPGKFVTSVEEATGFAEHILSISKDEMMGLTVQLDANASADHLLEAQTRQVSDRVTVTADENSGLYVDTDFFVETEAHSVDHQNANRHKVVYELSEATGEAWGPLNVPYVPKTVPKPPGGVSPHVPDDLWTNAISNGLRLSLGCVADKWNEDIDEGEFRAQLFDVGFSASSVDLRTVAEGGTLAHDGVTQWVVTGLAATFAGIGYFIKAASAGRLYFAFRLHNSAGYSVWSDGNDTPNKVIDYIDTEDAASSDTGPPADWAVIVVKGIAENTVRVRASRPKTNGHKIWFGFFQIKDATTGAWRGLSEASGVAGSSTILYDGSAQAHTLDPVTGELSIDAGGPADFGAGAAGGLVIVDMRAGLFDDKYCDWIAIAGSRVVGNKITGCTSFIPFFDPDVDGKYKNLRLMIVKPFWEWTAEGYQGNQTGMGSYGGQYWQRGGDKSTQTFESIDMPYDPALDITDIQGRVWFRNGYSFSDDDTVSPNAEAPPPVGNDPGVVILTWSATITIDCNLGSIFFLKLLGDCTLAPLVNAKNLRPIILVTQQDPTGGRHLFLDAKYNTGIDIDDMVCPMDSDERTYYGFMYFADSDLIDIVAFVRGYNG